MKKFIFAALAAVATMGICAQQTVVKIHRTNGTVETINSDELEKITFEKESSSPENPEVVDLGLSVKWASANLGANAPEKYGDYFAWGETETKSEYSSSNYQYYNLEWGSITRIGYEISGTRYDAAKTRLGGDWRMPTHQEWAELVQNCTWEWTYLNGNTGFKVTGPNGNSIFLPAAGRLYDNNSSQQNGYENISGFYWTSTLAEDDEYNYRAYRASLTQGLYSSDGYDVPEIGMSIRPVQGKLAETDPEPEPGPMDMVDLGLSVKWASHNVGAEAPEKPGNYYSWGMVKTQPLYGDAAYPYFEGDDIYTNIGADIKGTKYDVATIRWGEGWRMPTKAEMEELVNECAWSWTNYEGQYGYKVTGPNGNTIFLPAGGMMGVEGLMQADPNDYFYQQTGYYTSSEEKPSTMYPTAHSRYIIKMSKDKYKVDDTFKSIGILVRPVHQ